MNKNNKNNIEDIYLLSPMQQGILFHSLYAAEDRLYFNQLRCALHGSLNVSVFERAWQQVVALHPVLRTAFIWERQEQPIQVVYRQVKVSLEVHDWQGLSVIDQQQQLENFLQSDQERGFKVSKAPLMRLTLLQIDKDAYQFIWSYHHILIDGWSLNLVIQEVFTFYEAFIQNQDLQLKDRNSYRNYITWLQKQELTKAEQFWRQALKGFTAPTSLAGYAASTSSSSQEKNHSKQQIRLSIATTSALQSFAKQHQLTLNNLLQGAWALLLSRYSREEDIVFGVTVAGRPTAIKGVESIVGLFINTLPMRVRVSSEDSLLSWLKDIQHQQVEISQYDYSPLMKVQGWSEVPPGIPLFESIIVFENYPVDASLKKQKANLEVRNVCAFETTNYPLTLVAVPGTELSLKISYDCHRFEAATITRMLEQLRSVLEGITSNSHQRLSDISLLSAAEQQLLKEWNNPQEEYSPGVCIHKLFEAQVERTPDAVALIFEEQKLTYQELNQRANKLAHYLLKKLEIRPEALIGIYLERSLEMVIGLLGILKAGGAYVPLDPAYPQERLSYILMDAQVSVVLSQQTLVKELPKNGVEVLCLDREWETIAQESKENPFISGLIAENLAYVIYTSGSTGKPKGVLVEHSNISRLFTATDSWFHFHENDVWTLFHSYAFDFSVWELWGALIYGGQLVIVSYWNSRTPEAFYKMLQKEQVTVLNQTPSAFRQLMQIEESRNTSHRLALRLVIFGGEALELQTLKPWFRCHGDQVPQLVNMYGITETTVHVTYRLLTMTDVFLNLGSVIGNPLPDLQVYVLDSHQQLAPIGVPGELHVGGAGLARSYLNRPELTAQKFIPHSFSKIPGARLYKTGDLVRYLSDGNIEFLGRIDNQVKIRGFRIEIGEIEAILSQHPAICEVVVLAREDEPNKKRLVAYLVSDQERPPNNTELRSFVQTKLPEYMVPTSFIWLKSLPLTIHGKVDRKALPVPDTARPELNKAFIAPRTPVEKTISEIWAETFGLEQVGINDNFFELGGDSIRSIQILSKAKEKGLYLSIQQIFQHQTVLQLAQELETSEVTAVTTSQTKAFSLITEQDRLQLPKNIEDAYPLTRLQVGMIYHSQYDADSSLYLNIDTFRLRGNFHLQHFQTATQWLVARHPILRTSFNLIDYSEPIQLVHQTANIPLQVEDLNHFSTSEQEEALATWIESEKKRKFDITHPALLRFQIHHLSENTAQLTVTQYHAILDGWSLTSLFNELFQTYFALLNNQDFPAEPPSTILFSDFVALEQETLKSKATQQYWEQKLKDCIITELPRWSAADLSTTPQHGIHHVLLSPKVCDGVKKLAQSVGVPLKSVLLAAHIRVINLLSGQSDILTGVVCDGRLEEVGGDRVLGLFLNSLPFRVQLRGGTWVNLVQEIFKVEQELLPHRRYPIAELQKSWGRQPLFKTLFNFTNFHILKNVRESNELEVLETYAFAEDNFTLAATFDMEVSPAQQIRLSLAYDASELCCQQIEAISNYYIKTFELMVNEPYGHYEFCSLLSPQEQQQLLEWNNTEANYSQKSCIHDLFEMQAQLTPDVVAVVFGEQQLTYQQLNQKANQLAQYLGTVGVGPEVLVGIYVERSLEMIVGLLGILKAGGACVPIDPIHPQERLAFMLQNAQVSVLLTQQRLINNLSNHQAQVICLDTDWEVITHGGVQNHSNQPTADNLAFVFYTSGSTGKPKGVLITHKSVVNYIDAVIAEFALESSDRILQFASISFDAAIEEIFPCLSKGATLVLRTDEMLGSASLLLQKCSEFELTVLDLPIAYWHQIASRLSEEALVIPKQLRQVIIGGEKANLELVAQWYEHVDKNVGLIYGYGPTETTVATTMCKLSGFTEADTTPPEVSIGRPIANTHIYILDSHDQLVPVGVQGELYIGGVGLARAYLNHPELTAEKFVPNPWSQEPGARLYKTGDLARYLPDGNIEFLSRLDNQVKISGFRIELKEIEVALTQHPDVAETVVIPREDIPGNKRLVAYVVSHQESTLKTTDLRNFLKQKLPEYMIPSAFVMLQALPLTHNGKIDHRALPLPDKTRPELTDEIVAPRTLTENILAGIWAEVLGLKQISIYDNFFELGGHSLLAIRLMTEIQQKFRKDLPLAKLLQNSTIEQLAKILHQPTDKSPWSPLITIKPDGSQTPLFCVHGAGGTVIRFVELAHQLHPEQPFYGLQALGIDHEQEPYTQITEIASEYIKALQTVQQQGPYLLAGWSFGGLVALEMAQQLQAKGQEVSFLGLLDPSSPSMTLKKPEEQDNAVLMIDVFGVNVTLSLKYLQQLQPDEQLSYALKQVRQLNPVLPNAGREQLQRILRVYQSNYHAALKYVPQPYQGQFTIFQAREGAEALTQDLALGWGTLASQRVELLQVPGNHYTMLEHPHVQILAKQLQVCLEKAQKHTNIAIAMKIRT